jgi:hypothetical protein
MGSDKDSKASRDAVNRGLQTEQDRLEDPDRRPPHHKRLVESDASEAERPTTIQEDSEQDIAHMENPPQAEGPRERSNDGV